MKIKTIHFSYLRNEAHYQFLLLVKKLFESYVNVATIVTTLLTQLYALLTLEGKLVDAVRASEYTRQLVEIDRRLDRALAGLTLAIEAGLHRPDTEAVKAAERLEIRMNAFRGEIERKAYEEEAAAVKILVADLQGDYAPQVDALGLSVWLIEIASAQNAFEQVFLQRSAEHVDRPQERLKDVRREIEAVYRQIVERLDAYTVMNGAGLTGDFIAKLNDEITYFNEHNRHHRVPKDINLATVASIPDQPWDGQPATPLPDAVDEEGKPLVFGRDYDLRYRDNEQPGNATVTLHGHSAWKGKKTVSFVIFSSEISF